MTIAHETNASSQPDYAPKYVVRIFAHSGKTLGYYGYAGASGNVTREKAAVMSQVKANQIASSYNDNPHNAWRAVVEKAVGVKRGNLYVMDDGEKRLIHFDGEV